MRTDIDPKVYRELPLGDAILIASFIISAAAVLVALIFRFKPA